MTRAFYSVMSIVALIAAAMLAQPVSAESRSASFVNPGAVSQKSSEINKGGQANTLVAEPASIDAGETLVNISRRVTVFFYNGFHGAIQINDLTLNADGNVRSRVVTDDCKTVKALPPSDKCSVALEITPSSPGPWTVELLVNHSGTGRIARAEVNGTTLGKADEKSEGLAISKKIAKELDFGSVKANEEKATRTMLIENDSPMPLAISSIDLIATKQDGLTVRLNGCREGDELKPGESCPITVMWEPMARGNIATDLIVRHSGNLGFVVVPIRGSGTKEADKNDVEVVSGSTSGVSSSPSSFVSSGSASLMPRGPDGSSQSLTSMPALDALPLPRDSLGLDYSRRKDPPNVRRMVGGDQDGGEQEERVFIPQILLIGTVGKRAILGDAQEQTYMVNLGEKISIAGSDVELLQLDPTRAVVMVSGKRINLLLRNSQTIANQSYQQNSDDSDNSKQPKASGSTSGASAPEPPKDIKAGDSMLPTAPLPGAPAGLGSTSNGTGGALNAPVNNAMTSQDILNMMK